MTSTVNLNTLLEKASNWDKDERYMATNDLCNILTSEVKIDETMERRICSVVLKQLDDTSNDVQSVAVKCLAVLVKKVHEAQMKDICVKLRALVFEGKKELRDIYAIGLKTLIADAPDSLGATVVENLSTALIQGVSSFSDEDVKREGLDCITDLVKRFGHLMRNDHDAVLTVVMQQLECDRPVVRKRAAICLSTLAIVTSDPLLQRLVEELLGRIDAIYKSKKRHHNDDTLFSLIQTIGTISKTVGHRLGRHFPQLIPLFVTFCSAEADEEVENDLREHCLPGFESFIQRCPHDVSPFIDDILGITLKCLKYDPNYCYESDVNSEGSAMEEEYSDDEDYAAGSDDDDTSWKVRKAACRVLQAVVQSKPDAIINSPDIVDAMLSRFREREENVRVEVITCLAMLLEVIVARATDTTSPIEQYLATKLPSIVKACQKEFKETSVKSKAAVFSFLNSLVKLPSLHVPLAAFLPLFVKEVSKCMNDKHQVLKLEAAVFLRHLIEHYPPSHLQSYADSIVPIVTTTARDDWYKLNAESLKLVSSIITILRPEVWDTSLPATFNASSNMHNLEELYKIILPRVEALDADQDIRENAIYAAGRYLAAFADILSPDIFTTLSELLRRRLENDITRLFALRAIGVVAASPVPCPVGTELGNILSGDIASYLRQQSRHLRQAALQTLENIVGSQHWTLSAASMCSVLREFGALLNDSDLNAVASALRICRMVLRKCHAAPEVASVFGSDIMPLVLSLAISKLLQGPAMQELVGLFEDVVLVKWPNMEFDHLWDVLMQRADQVEGASATKSVTTLSKCVSAVCLKATEQQLLTAVHRFVNDVEKNTDVHKQLSLLCIGELGEVVDITTISPNIGDMIMRCFKNGSEDIKAAAAYALGHISVRNMNMLLPMLSNAVSIGEYQYLLFSALKETIVVHAKNNISLDGYLSSLLPLLMQESVSSDEGVRTLVAECLGIVLTISPAEVVPLLRDAAMNKDLKLRLWTISTAIRCSLTHRCSAEIFQSTFEIFLELLSDDDLEVRRASLLMLNAGVYYHAAVVAPFMESHIVPRVLESLLLKAVRTVDLGPFKHKVDGAIPIRKAALTCITTILDVIPNTMDCAKLSKYILDVLTDIDEVVTIAHQVICKLCVAAPTALIYAADDFIDPLEKAIRKDMPKDADLNQQDRDRNAEQLRSALRVVLRITNVEEMSKNRRWQDFISRLEALGQVASIMQDIANVELIDTHRF